jgi:hypothetical protein
MGEFVKDWSDEEALKEFEYYFDKDVKKLVVCDDCFKEIMKFHGRKLDYSELLPKHSELDRLD